MTASAAAAQLAASEPKVSSFVAAHAGTGKTKLLIDRLLRLMLAGADPARILCLTFTKAAAAEMAIRLQRQLGAWVTYSDSELNEKLRALDVAGTTANRQKARELFARVLDLPGGMRIATIHAFCQSLLRRFPLEAQISPHFELVDQADASAEQNRALEQELPRADPNLLKHLAGLVQAQQFAGLVAELEKRRALLAPLLGLAPEALKAGLRRAAEITAESDEAIVAAAVAWPEADNLRQQLKLAAEHASEAASKIARQLLEWLALSSELRATHFQEWEKLLFTKSGSPAALSRLVNPTLAKRFPAIMPAYEAEQSRLMSIQDDRRALRMVEATGALLQLARPILATYEAAKNRRAVLDYDDLITRTVALLRNPDFGAAWVLYKLDGGLDHLLLDEVQDTSRAQWEIANLLTNEFFAGESARAASALPRTIFAVGDRKQSIYGFQGANPAEFERWRRIYAQRTQDAGQIWRPVTLSVSFRSTDAILQLVDAIFNQPGLGEGVILPDEPLCHTPHRAGHAGRIEVWPLTPRPAKAEATPWSIPEKNQAQQSATQNLVERLADWIAIQTSGQTMLPSEGRPVQPGDILVLVRRRGELDRALVKALKARGVPVAGLDRMKLLDQPAVRDLITLCQAVLLPHDDLTLAELLVSPLGGLSDASLMELAVPREKSLWEELRKRAAERPDWQQADQFFSAVLSRADFAQPYALLCEALGPLGGRARLFARLGPEAAEPVDELLNAALLHASAHPPSLQGFLHWLELSAEEIKREPEAAGDAVRIMTVHGAKGLESPVVILPDTMGDPPLDHGLHWTRDPLTKMPVPLWQPQKDFRCRATERLQASRKQAAHQEHRRLLYVALTRARDWLLICGCQPHQRSEVGWYDMIITGLGTLPASASPFAYWPGETLLLETPQLATPPAQKPALVLPAVTPPAWAGAAPHWAARPLPPEPALPRPLAPSRPDGVLLGKVPASRSPLSQTGTANGLGWGTAMHRLLQHLPDLPPAQWDAAALAYARQSALGLAEPERFAAQALEVLRLPVIQNLFGPHSLAEQNISGLIGDRVITGQIDRLAITAGQILIADYKTNRTPPRTPQAVPVLYLRQMAAYRAVLAQHYPSHPITCLLIWTQGPLVMTLPNHVLDNHAPHLLPLDPAPAPSIISAHQGEVL